ncbi:MAG TPA: 3-phosphoserine/phosphohydroxythreonine transaminase [Candidatus Cloacimonadota bacterium]|nr:3-phosphoserine/phosphohydroxythreonine transaminase [Candidatus Cloacimonadota bacterium]
MRIHNFNAGPAVLPEEVLLEVQQNLLDYKGSGLSVMEMSHRSAEYDKIITEARAALLRLMGLGDDYVALYLQGGASTQFLMVPVNFCPEDKVANYINTGTWATNAWKEAKKIGKKYHVAASSEDKDYTYIPKTWQLSDNPAYLHITTNNTIRGTEWQKDPEVPAGVPLIADMSSNFLSRQLDFKKYDMIYGGAQKNIGPAGATFVVIKKSLMEQQNANLPTMLDYKIQIEKDSMFNTPPSFSIYVIGEVLKWIEKNGGLKAREAYNIEKAKLIYDILDSSDFYRGTVVPEDRSRMNVTFRLPSEDLEKKFISEAKAKSMIGLKGHRSVGGCRASLYNSLPMQSAETLAQFMIDFEKANK